MSDKYQYPDESHLKGLLEPRVRSVSVREFMKEVFDLEDGLCRYPVGWTCRNGHLDPDTGRDFLNAPERETCEICGRPRETAPSVE